MDFLNNGLLNAPWWAFAIALLAAVQMTIISVTLYLHRSQTHRGVDFHPILAHVFRFWLWLTTAMVTREWVAVHRKHHALCETEDDPHSPVHYGLNKVLFDGVGLYEQAAKNEADLEKYGRGCPNDWIERNLYSRFPALGPTLMLFIAFAAFGVIGVTFWALQMVAIPFFAAGLINGVAHHTGYRNFLTQDASTNLTPWALFLGGEELHNNHHAFPSSARFSMRRFELDIGWMIIQAMRPFGLAQVLRTAPKLESDPDGELNGDTLRAVMVHRCTISQRYYREVLKTAIADQEVAARLKFGAMRRQARKVLSRDVKLLDDISRERLAQLRERHDLVDTVCEYRARLNAIWDRSTIDPDQLLAALRQWCRDAEASGIAALEDFARSLRGLRLAT